MALASSSPLWPVMKVSDMVNSSCEKVSLKKQYIVPSAESVATET